MIVPSVKVKSGVWQQEVCIVTTQSLRKLPSATWQVEGQGRNETELQENQPVRFPCTQ